MIEYNVAWCVSFGACMLTGAVIGFVCGYCAWYYREACGRGK